MIRAQRVLASLTGLSRRACEDLLAQGRVRRAGSGEVLCLGQSIPADVALTVDGGALGQAPMLKYFAFHKPPSVLSSWSDPHRRPCLADAVMLDSCTKRSLLHVGRLDWESEGLLLLTSDGKWANAVSHPSLGVSKTYLCEIERKGGGAADLPGRLLGGVPLPGEDRPVRAKAASILPLSQARLAFLPCRRPLEDNKRPLDSRLYLQLSLEDGRNRVVRRALAALGFPVTRLLRRAIGKLALGGLGHGQHRELSAEEVQGFLQGKEEVQGFLQGN
jgi:23S rRNA pseudouridine2605 synthase